MRRTRAVTLTALACLSLAGCHISRKIVDLQPPRRQPPLEELEKHLDYTDPDAGKPDYVRAGA